MTMTYQEELQKRREAQKPIRDLYERIANLIGAKVDSTTVTSVEVNSNFFISVYQREKCVQLTLVRNLHNPAGRGNFTVDFQRMRPKDTDRAIINAYNRLVKEAKETKI